MTQAGFRLNTPVVLFIFNREAEAEAVFSAIAAAEPKELFIIGDGARASKPGENELVQRIRNQVTKVNWTCDVFTNFSDVNLGCKKRISSGLDWVFDKVDSAIILEDDCLPDPSFFQFCEELLIKYRDDESISHISGTNIVGDKNVEPDSYWFSKYTQIWGWATWKRVWVDYDVTATIWPTFKRSQEFKDLAPSRKSQRYWTSAFSAVHAGKLDTWDYQFTLLNWAKNYRTIIPNRNLISNIGFGQSATHTIASESPLARLQTFPMEFPLRHPKAILTDFVKDDLLCAAGYSTGFFRNIGNHVFLALPTSIQKWAVSVYRYFGILTKARGDVRK